MSIEKQEELQPATPGGTPPAINDLSQTQKDELLLKLLSVEETRKMRRRSCQAKYDKKKRAIDEDYRRQKNEKFSQYCKQKYQEDPDFREKALARARRNYYNRKQANLQEEA